MNQPSRRPPRRRATLALFGALLISVTALTSVGAAAVAGDPREGLSPGFTDAGVAASGLELLANRPKPAGFFNPANPGDFGFVNSDLAFQGKHAFVGNFNGFQIYDVSNPANPTIRTTVVCPGGQGEVSVYKHLLFMSAEESRARTDCGSPGVPSGDPLRFRGVRIFDISDLDAPVQVATVQTCRGSHTHTLLKSPRDRRNIYVYVNGTGGVRSATELAGCVDSPPTTEDDSLNPPARWRIEVIRVPLDAPQDAAVVNGPRLFRDAATGVVNGLQNAPPAPLHPSGTPWSPSPTTDSCHDITTYPEIGLAAGACEGNGLLIDIRDPANPRRIDEVSDPNWAYWHGATFSNDGKTVVFTDEWGGGTAPRCRATDQTQWGGNAIYDIVNGQLVFRSYFKMPAIQTNQENCVSHLPSLIPVPGRDLMVQAWYQAGASVIDFTDSSNPKEIGYYDRGPISTGTNLILGGLWSAYYFNGAVYGSEIARGFDAWRLTPTNELSANEIEAASEVKLARLTPQHQPRLRWRPSFAVVRSFRDQLVRADAIPDRTLDRVDKFIVRAERLADRGKKSAAAAQLRAAGRQLRGSQFRDLRDALDDLADSLRRGRDRDHDDDDD
jgi:LVIVD repeat